MSALTELGDGTGPSPVRRAGPGLGAAGLAAPVLPRGAVGFGAALPAGPGRAAVAGVGRGAAGFGVAAGRADPVGAGLGAD
ncbi:MAG: hypothetical protein WAL16_25155, partial [Streptosporangiaceae bacterium]